MCNRAPLIGISCDVGKTDSGAARAQVGMAYIEAVERAGGVAVLLPPVANWAARHVDTCDGIVTVGGADPDMTAWGIANHAQSNRMSPVRQAYEQALLTALDAARAKPVLGVCLGMQLMGLHAGGTINQHLPDTLREGAKRHQVSGGDAVHGVDPYGPIADRLGLRAGRVASNHHQALESAGRLEVVARGDDGVIEAVADPARRFYLGVQWHPERTADAAVGAALFARLVEAAGVRG